MTDKPRLKLSTIAGRPVTFAEPVPETPLERAQRRFGMGRKFVHEAGTDYHVRPAPFVLISWLRGRGK